MKNLTTISLCIAMNFIGYSANPVLNKIEDSLTSTNIGAFYEVSKKAFLMDTITATTINGAIVPIGCHEQSQKIVNGIYLNSWAKGKFEFTPADSVTLQTIADYTIEDCGLAVYDARVMLRYDKNDFSILERRMAIQSDDIIDDGVGFMYPNPAQNEAYYKITLDETDEGYIELIDINGQVVNKTLLLSGENAIKINLSELPNGLYLYRVIIKDEKRASNKLIIQK